LFLGAFGVFANQSAFASPFYKETNYYTIRVNDDESKKTPGLPLKVLILDRLIHSYNAPNDPLHLEYDYEYVYVDFMDYIAQKKPDFKALFLGGGGYTHPRYTVHKYPQSTVDVAEIDPGVTATAHEALGLEPDTPVRTYNEDARLFFLEKKGRGPYDLVFGDAFNDISVPYHLTTLEFDRKVRSVLRDDGFYLMNVIDRFRGGPFLTSVARTLRQVFPHVYVMAAGTPWKSLAGSPSTYVVAASATPLDLERLRRVRPQGFGGHILTNVAPADLLDEWLASEPSVLLTDDYAPTDNLIAPLFAERGL
jgi:spermidine synthase